MKTHKKITYDNGGKERLEDHPTLAAHIYKNIYVYIYIYIRGKNSLKKKQC